MTNFEADIAFATRQIVLEAIKSNQYADRFPNRAEEATKDVMTYAGWLTRNGVQAEVTTNGKTVSRVSVGGKVLVENGTLAQ